MMKRLDNFKLKTWHFIILFAVMLVSTNIAGNISLKRGGNPTEKTCCIEIDDMAFTEAVASNLSFILFYKDNSPLCDKMEENLNRFSEMTDQPVRFYKLNIEEFPGKYSKHAITGAPCVLVFKDGVEKERILGVVSVTNLCIIYNRVKK